MPVLQFESEERIEKRDGTLARRTSRSKGRNPFLHSFTQSRELASPKCIEKALSTAESAKERAFSYAGCSGNGIHGDSRWRVGFSEESSCCG